MSLRHALLVSLSRKQGTGYEITYEFDRGLGFFWPASHQQIYQELGKMATEGLVAFKRVQQTDKPPKKIYRLTENGKQSLVEWLASPVDMPAVKDPLLIKLFAGHLIPTQTLLDEIDRHIADNTEILSRYRSIEQQYFSNPDELPVASQFMYLTLLRGISAKKAWHTWALRVRRFLENRP